MSKPPAHELPVGAAADRSSMTRMELRALIATGQVRARVAGGFVYVEVASLDALKHKSAAGAGKDGQGHG